MAEPTTTTTTTKLSSAPLKSFMAAGPTLHYSHQFVHRFWGLTVVVYVLACIFWNRILIGGLISLVPGDLIDPVLWGLGRFVASPISIYEYPWQILVLGLLMGILAAVPVLASQLLSFRYSIPFILAAMFLAKLYFFGVFVLVSCVAVACRPLRFRSRFIAVALCMAPQVIYWAVWGGYETADPLRWGFSYSPWILSWLTGLVMAAAVLGVGHYTRYRPGLIFAVSSLLLIGAYSAFEDHIGFSELDYQRYVAGNNPEEVVEFHDYSISSILDAVIADDALRSELKGLFYPTESMQLREKLKGEIQNLLIYHQWPQWFQRKMPNRLKYQARRSQLLERYHLYMDKWPHKSKRMPTALYFTAMLNEYQPDVQYLGRTETLRFYNNIPIKDNILIWQELFNSYPKSPESLEARWRLAWHYATEEQFDRAMELCQVTHSLIQEQVAKIQPKTTGEDERDSIFSAFQPPPLTTITPFKLQELDTRVLKLLELISKENRGPDEKSSRRLATFIRLNPYAYDYPKHLESLLVEMPKEDPLRDNVLLAQAMLIPDARSRAKALLSLAKTYQGTDAGICANFETALSLLQVKKQMSDEDPAKTQLTRDIRDIFEMFLKEYPESIYANRARMLIQTLPEPN